MDPLLHRRNSKDRNCSSVDAPPIFRESKDQACSGLDPMLVRRDSKDRGSSFLEPVPPVRKDSKDRGISNGDLMPRRDSKDRGSGHGMDSSLRQDSKEQMPELLPRQDSKERVRNGGDYKNEIRERLLDQPPELLPRQDSKERARNDSKHESKNKAPELLPQQESKDRSRSAPEYRHESKDNRPDMLPSQENKEREKSDTEHRYEGRIDQPPELMPRHQISRSNKDRTDLKYKGRDPSCMNGGDVPPPLIPRQDSKDLSKTGLEVRRDSKDRSHNGSEPHHYDVKCAKSPSATEYRCEKERGYRSDGTPRRETRENHNMDQSKAQERNGSTMLGQHSSTSTPTHHGRSSGSPPITMETRNGKEQFSDSRQNKIICCL